MKNAISIERERDEQIVRLQPLLRAESDATQKRCESFRNHSAYFTRSFAKRRVSHACAYGSFLLHSLWKINAINMGKKYKFSHFKCSLTRATVFWANLSDSFRMWYYQLDQVAVKFARLTCNEWWKGTHTIWKRCMANRSECASLVFQNYSKRVWSTN